MQNSKNTIFEGLMEESDCTVTKPR